MRIGRILNRLLKNCALVAEQRHLPDVAEVLRSAAVLAGQDHLKDIGDALEDLVKKFEAKMVNGDEVTAADLPNIPPPVEADPTETFTPLVDEPPVAEAEPETEDEDLLAGLDDIVK